MVGTLIFALFVDVIRLLRLPHPVYVCSFLSLGIGDIIRYRKNHLSAKSYLFRSFRSVVGIERERTMQIIIKSRQMQVTPQLRTRIERKLQRLTRWVNDDARVEVTVAEEQTRSVNDKYSVQLALSGDSHPLRSEVKSQTATAALDLALDKIVTQLSRHKDRLTTKRHHATPMKVLSLSRSGSLATLEEGASTNVEEEYSVEEEENEAIWSKVVEIRRLPTRSMTDKEVIAQMEQEGDAFYPFFNAETNSVNVMYRLDNGGYGLLVPAQE